MKTDYRCFAKLVYNNLYWSQDVSDRQREAVEAAVEVLAGRGQFSNASLANLSDPLSMLAVSGKADAKLERVVDRCYRSQLFDHERNRVEFPFELFELIFASLVARKKARARRNSKS